MLTPRMKEVAELSLARNIDSMPVSSATIGLELETARHEKLVALWGIDVLRKTTISPVESDAIENVTMANGLANLLAQIVADRTNTIQRLEDRKLHATSYSAALLGRAAVK